MPIAARNPLSAFWQDWCNLVAGGWLFVAPWVLGYTDLPAAAWNSWIFGIIIVAISIAALVQFAQWEEWVNVIVGVWLLISPWVLNFARPEAARAEWNSVIVGVVVGALALWDALSHREPPQVMA
jgi:SPW repeat